MEDDKTTEAKIQSTPATGGWFSRLIDGWISLATDRYIEKGLPSERISRASRVMFFGARIKTYLYLSILPLQAALVVARILSLTNLPEKTVGNL